jgi:hypothetical protein
LRWVFTAALRLQKGLAVMDSNALGYLTDLNRNVEGALALLAKLAEYPELNHENFIIYQSYFREYLADTNMTVLDALEESEQKTMLTANRERVAYEKKIRDPDDCYFDVRNREEEIRAQGLLADHEQSLRLNKIFQMLAEDGFSRSRVADELSITEAELESMLFRLTLTSVQGGRSKGEAKPRPGHGLALVAN